MPTNPIPLTLSPGATANISGGNSIGLVDQTGVTEIPSFTGIPGTATITVTPALNGCLGIATTINFTINPVISNDILLEEKLRINAHQFNIASLRSQVIGGTAPFTYQWKKDSINFSTDRDLLTLTDGIYELTVTDANGCISLDTYTLSYDPNPGINRTLSGDFNIGTGIITAGVLGGTAPYTYKWYDNTLGASLSNQFHGNYEVIAIDSDGHYIPLGGQTRNLLAGEAFSYATYRDNNRSFTSGSNLDGFVLVANPISASGETFTYLWNTGQTTSVVTLSNVDRSIPYTYTVTITGSLGNNFFHTVNVLAVPIPSIALTITNSTGGLYNGSVIANLTNINANNKILVKNNTTGEVFNTLTALNTGAYKMVVFDKTNATSTTTFFNIL